MKLSLLLASICVLSTFPYSSSAALGANSQDGSSPRRLLQNTGRELQQARIVNGWEAVPDQYPFAAFLRLTQMCLDTTTLPSNRDAKVDERGNVVCAGSLIMPRVLVSAGHCLFKCSSSPAPDSLPGETPNAYTELNRWGGPINAKINQSNIDYPSETVPGAEYRTMSGVIRHPDYVSVNALPMENDVSLMWFEQPSKVTPVRIAKSSTFQLGEQFMVAGWGFTNPNYSSLSNVLRTAEVPYVPPSVCNARYQEPVWPGNICAGSNPANYADACAGDSGGPMMKNSTTMVKKDGKWVKCTTCQKEIVGVTSYGESCANDYPGVYTNIPAQADWIDQTITLSNAGGLERPKLACAHHVGHRYYGSKNSTYTNIANAAQCCNACKVSTTCRSWSWSSDKKCVLIQNVEKRELDVLFTSGNVTGTIPAKSAYAEYEFYVQYSDPKGTRTIATLSKGAPAKSYTGCAAACKLNKSCKNMTYDTLKKRCTLFKGPGKFGGWNRKAWQYRYVSALVSRR